MRAALAILLGLSILAPRGAWGESGAPEIRSPAVVIDRDPYAHDARQALVAQARDVGDHAIAYYHATWLAWLGPRQYADSDAGLSYLRDRATRERASRSDAGSLAPVIAAVEAKELLANSCCNGAIGQQAGRLSAGITDLIARAEEAEARSGGRDPVARIALAHLYLSLDDALTFAGASDRRRSRLRILRQAASRAAAVVAWLPESPGAHRTLAVVRARLAELDNQPELWDLAIAEANRAHQLDPADASLVEFLWTLHLRAGHWAEARRWQARLNAPSDG
jgi:hypothetical protein